MQSELFNTTYTILNQTGDYTEPSQALFSDSLELVSFILSVLGITANGTAILATTKMPNGNTTHSKLIINLCVSDGLVLIAISLNYILDIFSDILTHCKDLFKPVFYIALIATLINLLAMAIDHYVAIVKPLHHRQLLSNFRGSCIVMGIWVFSITAGLLEFIVGLVTKAESGNNTSVCMIIFIDEYDLEMFIIGFIFVVQIFIVTVYTKIYIRLKSPALTGIPRQQTSKLLLTTALLMGTFTLCWTPMGIYQIYMNVLLKTNYQYLIEHLKEFSLVNKVLLIILQMNSLVDPLIYAIRLPQVRMGCQAVFTSQRCGGLNQDISLPMREFEDQSMIVVND